MTSVAALLGRILCLASLIVTTAVMGNSHCQAGHGECSVDDDAFAARVRILAPSDGEHIVGGYAVVAWEVRCTLALETVRRLAMSISCAWCSKDSVKMSR